DLAVRDRACVAHRRWPRRSASRDGRADGIEPTRAGPALGRQGASSMSGQRIFITGGASGLGRALAERYARQGVRICIGDVNDARGAETQAALAALGATAQYLRCDVTREEDLQAAADWMQTNWGGADLVFNNAGVADLGAIEDVPMKDWAWIVD